MGYIKHLAKTTLLLLIGGVAYCQTAVKPAPFEGKRRLNEVENSNGVISNAIYEDNVLTKKYQRYRADSTKYVEDSLAYNRLIKPVLSVPIKPKKSNKKVSNGK